jgi:hypothetical protein
MQDAAGGRQAEQAGQASAHLAKSLIDTSDHGDGNTLLRELLSGPWPTLAAQNA